MTVNDLRAKLANLDGRQKVVVYWEDENETHFWGIDDISVERGTPKRLGNDKPGFTFDRKGPAEWVFIAVSPE